MSRRYERKNHKNKMPIWIILGIIFLGAVAFWLFQEEQAGDDTQTKTIKASKNLPLPRVEEKVAINIETMSNKGSAIFDGDKINKDIAKQTVIDEVATTTKIESKLTELKLEKNDDGFRRGVDSVSKKLVDWFDGTDIIKKYIVVINDLSQNQIIYKHRGFIKAPGRFLVKKDSYGLYVAEESYTRYEQFTDAIVSIDMKKGLDLYLLFKPLFVNVYKEFAYPKGYHLEDIFMKAAASVINAPVLEGRISLVKHSIIYKYADKNLEELNDVEKLMLRMGPENTKKIQVKLRQLVEAIAELNK